jgi:hypothetical protein
MFEPLVFPEVRLDAGILELPDPASRQLRSNLSVEARTVVRHGFELGRGWRNEKLEHEPSSCFATMLGEVTQCRPLAGVDRGIPVGVVSDESLRPRRLDLVQQVRPPWTLEAELLAAALFHGDSEPDPCAPRFAEHLVPVRHVDEHGRRPVPHPFIAGAEESSPDQPLGEAGALDVLFRGLACHAEERRHEGSAMIEREHVQAVRHAAMLSARDPPAPAGLDGLRPDRRRLRPQHGLSQPRTPHTEESLTPVPALYGLRIWSDGIAARPDGARTDGPMIGVVERST